MKVMAIRLRVGRGIEPSHASLQIRTLTIGHHSLSAQFCIDTPQNFFGGAVPIIYFRPEPRYPTVR